MLLSFPGIGGESEMRMMTEANLTTTTTTTTTRVWALAAAVGFAAAALLLVVMAVSTTKPAQAATTFTVNSIGDHNDLDFPGGTFDGSSDGKCDVDPSTAGDQCTLRAAIQGANKLSGADTIAFAMPGSGVQTISPLSQLPTITQQVTIDGYTQSGATKNTLTQPGKTNAALKIVLSGAFAPDGADGLEIDASNVVVKGLVINDFITAGGITLIGGTGHRIEGNFIGTDPAGTLYKDNGNGVFVIGDADNSTIGGTTPEARNLISGNVGDGVDISGTTSGNKVQGNLIGTNKDGTSTPNNLGNGGTGVYINGASNNTVGDSDPTDGATNAANTLAFNANYGVRVGSSIPNTGNRILSNSIFSNLRIGIQLVAPSGTDDANFVTPNDPKDPDTGPNRQQNYPLLSTATTVPTGTSIQGTLNSTPSTRKQKKTFIIQFFSSPAADAPSGYGEGQTYLGQVQVTTDRQGNTGTFGFAPFQKVPVGQFITATATNKKTGDTSEFSEATVVEEPDTGG